MRALNVVVVVMVERVINGIGNGRRQRRATNASANTRARSATGRKRQSSQTRRHGNVERLPWSTAPATVDGDAVDNDNASAKRKRGRVRCKRDERRRVVVVAGNGPARMVAGRNG